MRIRTAVFLLIVITFLVYLSSLWNQFVWDDEQFIYKNTYVLQFDLRNIFTQNTVAGAATISNYYRPLTTLSFAIDNQVWGLHEFGFHLTNTFLHIACGILLFGLLLKLGIGKKSSFWLSLIFLVHPIQTEAVTYINSRGDSLYTFFGLLSVLCFLFVLQKEKRSISIYNLTITVTPGIFSVLSIAFYIASVFSKEIGIATIGLHFLVLIVYLVKEKATFFSKKFLLRNIYLIPTLFSLVLTAAIYLGLRSSVLNFNNSFNFYSEKSLYGESLLVRLLTFSKIILIYCKLLLIPFPLFMERNTDLVTSFFSFFPWITMLIFSVLLYIGWLELKKTKKIFIWFGLAWFLGMLVPDSGIVPINGLLYEHWLYLPMVGFFIVIWRLTTLFLSNIYQTMGAKNNLYILSAYIVTLSILTIRQNYFWSTPIHLYEHLLHYTRSGRIYNNLAMAYADAGQKQKALDTYQKSLQFGDFYPQVHHNMGNAYRDLGDTTKAIEEYKKAIAMDKNFFYSYNALFILYTKQQMYEELLTESKATQTLFDAPDYYLFEIVALKGLQQEAEAKKIVTFIHQKYGNSPRVTALADTLFSISATDSARLLQ